ncbi:MAG: hypothetical protein KR126chlam6_01434 [Candidatus Anoxychlamydiales bacterium]|nr:hypothetical protein [Candidatus Anoxychlamydiales bacterium]
MKDYTVPIALQSMLQNRVNAFYKQKFLKYHYYVDARGKFIYLYRLMPKGIQRLGRLTYLGDPENMEFTIFNDLSEKYDPKKRLFSGSVYLDGTIEGALKAVVEAYP